MCVYSAQDDDEELVTVSEWIKFKSPAVVVELIKEFRWELNQMLLRRAETPHRAVSSAEEELLRAVSAVFQVEERDLLDRHRKELQDRNNSGSGRGHGRGRACVGVSGKPHQGGNSDLTACHSYSRPPTPSQRQYSSSQFHSRGGGRDGGSHR
jgi:hypothetical protein